MQYRTVPKTGEKLSVLGYGCMRLPAKGGRELSSFIDIEKAKAQIFYAIDNGVNYLDTAYTYHLGASESFLGEHILNGPYREKVNIATKLPCFLISKRESIEKIFEKQLSKLKVDYIDYYFLHALEGISFEKMLDLGIIDFINREKARGRIRNMGFSYHGRREDFKKIVDSYDWIFTMAQFNILDEHFQAGIEGIQYAAEQKLAVFAMEPLRGGSLANRVPKEVQKIYDSAHVKRSAVDWALRWVLDHSEITMLLSGMNEMSQIKENIEVVSNALPNTLSKDEKNIIRNVRNKYIDLLKVKCTGCGYCLPCPVNIDIPSALKYFNEYHMISRLGAKARHALYAAVRTSDGNPHWASSCINCGQCEENCPQHLPIREHLKAVTKDLESSSWKLFAKLVRIFSKTRVKKNNTLEK